MSWSLPASASLPTASFVTQLLLEMMMTRKTLETLDDLAWMAALYILGCAAIAVIGGVLYWMLSPLINLVVPS